MLVRWLDGSLEEVEASTITELEMVLQQRCGRNQQVKVVEYTDHTSLTPVLYNAIVVKEPKLTPDECTRVFSAFVQVWGAVGMDIFCDALRSSCAVIAGGAVVNAYTSTRINDFDVYINRRHAADFIRTIRANLGVEPQLWGMCAAAPYDNSFMRQNRVLCRVPFVRRRGDRSEIKIDLIVLSDEVEVLQVVSNFDLTFCESWWDGQYAYSNDPDGLRNREGWLKPAYTKRLFEDLNVFTIRRIRKYRARGWKVFLSDDPQLNGISFNDVITHYDENVEEIESRLPRTEKVAEELSIRLLIKRSMDKVMLRENTRGWSRVIDLHVIAYMIAITPEHYTYDEMCKIIGSERVMYLLARDLITNTHVYREMWYIPKFCELFGVKPTDSRLNDDERLELENTVKPLREKWISDM